MKAIRIHAYGCPEVMRLEELTTPAPGAGEALVRIHAASVNFLDVQKRRGELAGQGFYARHSENELPAFLGSQGVGVVEALGAGVTNVKPGDRVSFFFGNSYATHAVVPAARLMRIPSELTFESAASGRSQGVVSYAFSHHAYPINPGDWCLVHAAAGGAGLLLCQMAKIRG